jgi:hypothetical protein
MVLRRPFIPEILLDGGDGSGGEGKDDLETTGGRPQ